MESLGFLKYGLPKKCQILLLLPAIIKKEEFSLRRFEIRAFVEVLNE
jgi:hypothetical protein